MTKRLLAFFSIGLFIFILDILFEDLNDDKNIVIFDAELVGLINNWTEQVGRKPSKEELNGIINQLVDEEILYREALSLGLDKNDIIIKRRLAQKIGFLKQEQISAPSDSQIEEYYLLNQSNYSLPTQYTFTQIYFSHEKDEKDGKKRAVSALKNWQLNKEQPYGDPFLLGKNYSSKSLKEIERIFGEIFSTDLKTLERNVWSGPLESSYGFHLVLIASIAEERTPEYNTLKSVIISDLMAKRKEDSFKAYLEDLRGQYTIQVNKELIN
jgi:peptidyl-prolyl cis-trans isomerase C